MYTELEIGLAVILIAIIACIHLYTLGRIYNRIDQLEYDMNRIHKDVQRIRNVSKYNDVYSGK